MRSSKSRSRSKGSRNRSVGNIVNRVFDSSGPEGKVRGTPQQIIDKYNQLARDAQLSNDRVAAENFQQHAEHYLRMLAEAQRDMQERQQSQQGQQGQQGQGGNQNTPDQRQNDAQGGSDKKDDQGGSQQNEWRGKNKDRSQSNDSDQRKDSDSGRDVIDMEGDSDGGLVETPEDKPKRARKPRNKPAPPEPQATEPSAPDAAE